MNILTNNLILRAIEKSDNAMLRELINDPQTESMLGGWSFPVSEAAQENWFNSLSAGGNALRCIIAQKTSPETALGTVMLTDIDMKNGSAQAHIKLAPSGRGKGYGSEALNAVTDYAFKELRLHSVYARVNEDNAASAALFKKCGFKQDGVLRELFYKNGRYINVMAFSLLNGER